ncbi:hypothetical protein [Dokdonella immobilis]|uniref:Nucleotidyltransferase family protein n=1 Tax=Dokdonella immobilis TaxID=578942 RepID=A0A1I4WEC7_9GAMM|nr:hypothetical protein [Dokdonella immobilis]SFN11610.1 hypothetical protein SAMN05216289_104202 [Dokdonella immobilis]
MPALIGGLALAAYAVVRGTRDVDFLVDVDDADRLHGALIALDYRCVHRSADAANYVREDEGLDLIYAHRPIARRLLRTALERDTPMVRLRVVSAEALIGFKLRALVNDLSRGVICPIFVRCCVRKPLVSIWPKSVSTLRCSSARSCWMSCLPKSPTVAPEQRAEGLRPEGPPQAPRGSSRQPAFTSPRSTFGEPSERHDDCATGSEPPWPGLFVNTRDDRAGRWIHTAFDERGNSGHHRRTRRKSCGFKEQARARMVHE